MAMTRVINHLLMATLAGAGFAGLRCGEVGGDGDANQTHIEVLDDLNVNVNPGEPTNRDDEPLPEGYNPLGSSSTAMLVKSEVYAAGFSSNGRNQYLFEDAKAQWKPLHSMNDESWSDADRKNIIAADVDGDGFDEVVIVYFAEGRNSLESIIIDRFDGSYVEHTVTVATSILGTRKQEGPVFAEEVSNPAITAGDLDGDGREEVAVAFSTWWEEEQDDYGVPACNTTLYVMEDMLEDFTATSRAYPDSARIHIASGELDGDGQAELVVTYDKHEGWLTRSCGFLDIFDGDLRAPLLVDGEQLVAENAFCYSLPPQVALGDLDGDALDEIVFFGYRVIDAGGQGDMVIGYKYNLFLHGRDDARHGLDWLPMHVFAGCWHCAHMGFALLDQDGDGREDEIRANEHVFRYEAEDGTVENPVDQQNCQDVDSCDTSNYVHKVWTGDVDGDARDELLYFGTDGIRMQELDATGEFVDELIISGSWNQNANLCLANVDDDSPVLRYRGEHELLFTDPTPLAVLAAPPYHGETTQCDDYCGTTFGQSSSSGVEKATTQGVSVGFSVGVSASDPFGVASASVKATVEAAMDWSSSHATEVSQSIAYSSGIDEDKVIFTAVPFDVYYYDIVSSPNPEAVGTVMSINIPRQLATYSVSREFYNSHNGDFTDIDESVINHTFGDVRSYPTFAESETLIRDGGLRSLVSPVGIGSGSITVTVSRSESIGEGTSFDFTATVEAEIEAAGISAGRSESMSYGWERSITNTEMTFYEGTIDDIPVDDYRPDLDYTFGLFTYPDSLDGQTFTVVNYWVE